MRAWEVDKLTVVCCRSSIDGCIGCVVCVGRIVCTVCPLLSIVDQAYLSRRFGIGVDTCNYVFTSIAVHDEYSEHHVCT